MSKVDDKSEQFKELRAYLVLAGAKKFDTAHAKPQQQNSRAPRGAKSVVVD